MKQSLFFAMLFLTNCSTPEPKSLGQRAKVGLDSVGKIDPSVLNDRDIQQVRDMTDSNEQKPDRFIAHFWDCFENATQVKVVCSPFDEDQNSKGDQLIAFTYNGEPKRNFVLTRASDYETCLRYRKELQKLTDKQNVICFTGANGSFSDKGTFDALFIRAKTKTGCLSYYINDCAK